jgi:hypothetical protein
MSVIHNRVIIGGLTCLILSLPLLLLVLVSTDDEPDFLRDECSEAMNDPLSSCKHGGNVLQWVCWRIGGPVDAPFDYKMRPIMRVTKDIAGE